MKIKPPASLLVVIGIVAATLAVSHLVVRNSPIKIHYSLINSVMAVCSQDGAEEDKEVDQGGDPVYLEQVTVHRYPPYDWTAHCSNGNSYSSEI